MNKIAYLLLLVIATGCKDDYDLPVNIPATGYLVVEGNINSGQGNTTISLSKTVRLVDTFNVNYVSGASVNIEGEDNSVYPLTSSGIGGQYINDQLILNPNSKYRLHIQLPEGKEYISEYLPVNKSPKIDSLNWERDEAGLNVFVNAHGTPGSTSGYYRWDYDENWEYHANFAPVLRLNNVPKAEYIYKNHSADGSKFFCYTGSRSTTIEILSTAKLNRDTTHYRIASVPNGDRKLSVLYSCNVRQYAISRECFEYLARMKKNTEQTGSIFDAQPSELRGNITCVTNPEEPVIGFVQISDVFTQRIFVKNSDVPGWGYLAGCNSNSVVNNPDSISSAVGLPTYEDVVAPNGDIIRFFMATPECVDCTLRGGTTVKPDFWP